MSCVFSHALEIASFTRSLANFVCRGAELINANSGGEPSRCVHIMQEGGNNTHIYKATDNCTETHAHAHAQAHAQEQTQAQTQTPAAQARAHMHVCTEIQEVNIQRKTFFAAVCRSVLCCILLNNKHRPSQGWACLFSGKNQVDPHRMRSSPPSPEAA